MTMRESLLEAMHVPSDSDTARWMQERGVAVTDVDTMSQAIHDVYAASRPITSIRTRRTTSSPRC